MINIYFFRHASAEDGFSKSDFERNLVEKGQKEVKTVSAFCKTNKILPNKIFSSPYLRTMQTANIFSECMGIDVVAKPANWLRSDASVNSFYQGIIQLLSEAENGDDYFVISHEPNISGVITALLGNSQVNRTFINVRKASLTQLSFANSNSLQAELMFSLPVQMMG